MKRARVIIVFLAVSSIALNGQKVGASMALEGRAAIIRASQHLTALQQENGQWDNDVPLTALAAEALLKTQDILQDDAVAVAAGKALAVIRTQQTTLAPSRRAIAIRAMLAAQDDADTNALRSAATDLCRTKDIDASTALWLMDALWLTADALRIPPPLTALSRRADGSTGSKPEQLAAAIANGNTAPNAIKALYSAARNTRADSAAIPDLYWLSRSCQACNTTSVIPYDGWKADVIAALLERQRGNGAWLEAGQSESDDIRNTALAIQTIILCLID